MTAELDLSQRGDQEHFVKTRYGIRTVGHRVFWCGPYRDALVLDAVAESFEARRSVRIVNNFTIPNSTFATSTGNAITASHWTVTVNGYPL